MDARRFAPVGLALAVVLTVAGLGYAAVTAAPVPTCVEPTGTISNAKVVAYVKCRSDRLEALLANHDAPTATPSPTTPEPSPSPSPSPTPEPTPTPTPEPTPTPTPEPTPTASTFPDASTTGVPAGTSLTTYSGPTTISTAGTVIDGKRLGCILVNAPGVVIRNSVISCRPSYAAVEIPDRGYTGTSLLLENVEITCQDGPGIAVGEAHVTIRRANIHGCENGVDVNQDITVEDSFIHDLYNGNDAHADGIQLASRWNGSTYIQGAKDVVVRHNTIFSADAAGALGTSALISNPKGDVNILIENNLLAGGAYTLYCPVDVKGVEYRVLGNHFSTRYSAKVGAFGSSTGCSDEEKSGNVIHETGAPIALD